MYTDEYAEFMIYILDNETDNFRNLKIWEQDFKNKIESLTL